MTVIPGDGPSKWRSAVLASVLVEEEPRPIFKHGAISGIGRQRNIVASIGMNGCRLTGALVANRGWKRSFDDPVI